MPDILPSRGRLPSASLLLEVVRPLTAADIIGLAAGATSTVRSGPPPIKTLKTIHHHAARLVAAGHTDVEVAAAVGRTPQRIRDLRIDPSFAELVSVFASESDAILSDEITRARNTMIEVQELAMEELRERLEDDQIRRAMPTSEVRQIATMASDRSVAPPKQSAPTLAPPTSITFNIAGRAKLRDETEDTAIINVTPVSVDE